MLLNKMVVDQIKQLDTSGDNKINEAELREAMKPNGFLSKEENLSKVGELLNSGDTSGLDQELLSSLEQSFYTLKGGILNKERITDEDKFFLEVYKRVLGGKCGEEIQEIDNFIVNQEELRRQDEEEQKVFNSILQEIESEILKTQDDYIENLRSLGIDCKTQFKRNNLKNDIKSIEDLEKIDGTNIVNYINIPEEVPNDYYEYIANNIKIILNRHLQLHPDWKTVLGKGGYSTGMNIDNLWKNDVYMTNIIHQVQILEKKDINQQVLYCVNSLPNGDLLDLWLKRALNNKDNKQEDILKKVFDKITPHQSDKFFKACENNGFINELKSNYAIYWLNKNNSIKADDKYCFLDRANKSKFENFKGKGINLSKELTFDNLYNYTENFYKQLGTIGLDESIPIGEIISFLNFKDKKDQDNKILQQERDKEIARNDKTIIVGNPEDVAIGHVNMNNYTYSKFSEKLGNNCLSIDKEYVKLLLKSKRKPTGKIPAISGADYTLDFSKGNDPDKIIRDSWGEKFGDQRDKFKYDLKNDRQAAFGSAIGMIGGIAGSAAAAIFTRNIRATSAGFTIGLRLGNGIGQELWNSGEFLYEQISGNTISDGNNKVEKFGQGFLRGVGALDQNYEYVGTAKFLSGLGFDYLSTVATFGLSSKFGGLLGKLEGVKFAGGALKFGIEELILENFFVDIPMNIVQTGFETFTGIDDGITIGNTAIGNQRTQGSRGYQSGSLSDALIAMKEAATQNLSFENLSQTFFNTIIYGGFLEGGGAAIKNMKGYLPAGQVSNFTEKSAIAATAFAGLTNFMTSKKLSFNKDGKCVDSSTNLEITELDPRFQELCIHLQEIKSTEVGVIEAFETIMKTQRQMVADPENRTGLLFRLGLVSPTNTPLNILNKKKELVEKKLQEAKSKGDIERVNQLQKLLDIYIDAESKLNNSDYFDGKSHQFEVTEQQARSNRELMDRGIVHFEKISDQSRTFELPLKDHVCEYIRLVKEGEYPDRQKYLYKNGKLTEDPNGCYIKLNEGDITPEEGRECFLRGLKISSELMNGQKNRAVLSSGSLFLNIESYGKLGGDIDIATDVTAFNNVALQRGSDGLTTLERFQRDGKIRDLIFTKIDHSVIDIKNMSEHEITELIERGDIRVEFNIPDAKGNTINCEFFPEPEGYGLIQLGTPRADGGLLSYEIEGNLIKTVSPELAAMSYMINLAHEFENNSLDAWNKTKEKAKDKGKRNIPKLKDSVRMNNFFQYLESANIRTVSDMINYIDRTIANYEQQHGKKIEIEVTEGDKKVKKTIDMSAYLRKGLDKLPDVKKLLQDVEIDYQKTLGNSRIKALRGTETKLSFNQFMNETLKIKEELFNLKDVEKTPQKRDEIMREIYNLQKMVNINDPKSFSYYYEIYQLKTNFLYKVFGKNN